jgi:hypothetical protein
MANWRNINSLFIHCCSLVYQLFNRRYCFSNFVDKMKCWEKSEFGEEWIMFLSNVSDFMIRFVFLFRIMYHLHYF